jgi:transcriptional regulator with XRE-family HTH domain
MTQAKLARLVGVTVPTISRLENGRHAPRDETLCRLAAALGAEEPDLLYERPPVLQLQR